MQYAIYLRKSRADIEAEAHGEGETLLRHEKALLDLAKRQKLNVTEIYREVVSGETISARPMMQKLLEEVEQGIWSGVLVMEVERLARGDTIDQGIVSQAFKYTGTKIITPMKVYDPSNEFDEEYFEFGLFMSRREYKTINRRIQRGRMASVKEGKYISSVAPYGYDRIKIKNDKGYTLKSNPDQAAVVKMIYDLYTIGELQADGTHEKLGTLRIAKKLDSIGIKPMIKDTWSRASIQDILKNPVYTGKIRWSYRKSIKTVRNNEIIVTRPNSDDYILVDGMHEPIIDPDTFRKAQDIISKRGRPPVPGSSVLKNPLSGILYCGKCGSKMTRLGKNKKTPYDAIKCPNRYCDNISSPLYLVENVLVNELKKWLSEFKVKWNAEKLDVPYSQAIKDKETAIKRTKLQLDKLHEQRDRTFTFLEQGLYTPDIFTERSKKLSEQISDTESIIHKLNNDLKKLKEQANKNEVFIPKAEHILYAYEKLKSASAKNENLKEIIEKVEYVKTEPNRKGNRENPNFILNIYPRVIKF
ncbi:MAG: recombinase family protein [Lachnospiraceae bacterium]|jgi:DNA invertase Pin-like site-specific DNA recombinase|nr:recombinase family protein [Lachnospiraceae bacterium]